MDEIEKNKKSLTGQFLSGKRKISFPASNKKPSSFITIKNAHENNLKNIDVDIPIGIFTCITGVSGSVIFNKSNSDANVELYFK